jgi:uncharacterized membrane-anchored protein
LEIIMLNRLSGTSFRVRIGLGVAMLAGAGSAWFTGWGWITLVIAAVAGGFAAYKVGNDAF